MISILVNNQLRTTVSLPAGGIKNVKFSVDDLPDGKLTVKAFSEDSYGNRSGLSTVLVANKDTKGPLIQEKGVSFIISPATDTPMLAIGIRSNEYASLEVSGGDGYSESYDPADWIVSPLLNGTMNVVLYDKTGNASVVNNTAISPAFHVERDATFMESPPRLSGFAKQIALISMLAIVLLLTSAIIIKVRIQHPRMIVSASVVLLLASIIFLW